MEKLAKLNHADQRCVLLLNLNNEKCQWDENFKALNWHCIHSTDTSKAIQHIKKNNINVAIAMISSAYQHCVFKALSRILKVKSNISWIAISCDNLFPEYLLASQHPTYFSDYHHLPVDWSKLGHTLGHAMGMAAMKADKPCDKKNGGLKNNVMLGKSTAIQHLNSAVNKIASVDATVLISGETGTGKGLCAHLIHAQSARKNGPFITVNCGALPTTLIHSELFGYDKGAFTGANKTYIGHIERADKGTLFLDEIGDLTLESQIQLLQFIEDRTIERLGGNHRRTIDCRIIFASHVDLESAVDKGQFREDLYHRLNILRIHVPSLREHKEDIKLLANAYLKLHKPAEAELSFSTTALETMFRYEWPGNVRELKNRIQRAVVMTDNTIINEQDMGIKAINDLSPKVKLVHQRVDIDTEVLLDAINRNNHNISAAAKELNISRTTFYRLIKKCKIKIKP
ncbi:MAG: sigma 54-interacting transcriptional regulator [Photobacterium frigidiphilum]|uniref:sigma-54 dependent transcriptional regulator n=1 Tax=Photobacterium frigidiphilum TaxID=264736 RepID=UPI003001CA85